MHQHLAVLGSPISHSRSPRIHAAAYAVLGLDWAYEAIECSVPQLEPLLASRDESWRGFSVTMPLKVEAHRLSSVLDPVAGESGVVNTLFRLAGGAGWAGFNTDVLGLAEAVRGLGLDAERTVVLGAGATAVSAVLAARSLGASRVTVLARRAEAAEHLARRFDGPGLSCGAGRLDDPRFLGSDATLVISTLPGPAGSGVELPLGIERTPLFDVAYDPWPSPLAGRWQAAGGVAHPGLDMLVQQALAQLRIFIAGDPGAALEREAEVLAAMRAAAVSCSPR